MSSQTHQTPENKRGNLCWRGGDSLINILGNIDFPWLVSWDFNSILDIADRVGGIITQATETLDFLACINASGLLDLGYNAEKLTWSNNRVWSRIDRALSNLGWLSLFSTVQVSHLARLSSDHSPHVDWLFYLSGQLGFSVPSGCGTTVSWT